MLNFYEFYMLMEQEEVKPRISPAQSAAFKKIYIQIRDLIKSFIAADFNIAKTQDKNFIRKGWKFHLTNLSEYKAVFPNLDDNFFVSFNSDESSTWKEKGIIRQVNINIERIKGDEKATPQQNEIAWKSTLQHELQHFLTSGSNLDVDASVEDQINYLSSGEVETHAKQMAYVFRQWFKDDKFDLDKVISKMPEGNQKDKISNYKKFLDESERNRIAEKTSDAETYKGKMKKTGEEFLRYTQWYLDDYKKKQDQGSTPKEVPAVGETISLEANGQSLNIKIKSAIGKSVVSKFGEDSQFWSEPQFTIDKTPEGGWMVTHDPNAANATMLNGKTITGSQALSNGSQLAVGNEAKGVIKLPLTVTIS